LIGTHDRARKLGLDPIRLKLIQERVLWVWKEGKPKLNVDEGVLARENELMRLVRLKVYLLKLREEREVGNLIREPIA